MLFQTANLVKCHLRAIIRDRLLYAVLGVAVAMLLLVPVLSSFSMRQVQELAITLSLSAVSAVLLVLTLLLGSASIWRDVERRYHATILTLPVSRSAYIFSKFVSIAFFLAFCALLLGLGASLVIWLSSASYPSDIPIHWGNIAIALCGAVLKCLLLASFALLLSAVSTSFYLPFFGTLAIYFCGSASQEVFEYVSSQFGQELPLLSTKAVTVIYYLLPNLSGLDFQMHAVYGLTVPLAGVFLVVCYTMIYTAILLGLAMFAFSRRELP